MPKLVPHEIRAKALEMRRQGRLCVDIAHELDISPQVVSVWSRRERIPLPKPTARPIGRKRPGAFLRNTDSGYGLVCDCGGRKSLTALRCKECRDADRRVVPVTVPAKTYSTAIIDVWPIPGAFLHIGIAPREHRYAREEPDA